MPSMAKSNASHKRVEERSRNARGNSHGLIKYSANAHVRIGANYFDIEEHARFVCEHAYQAHVGYVWSLSHNTAE